MERYVIVNRNGKRVLKKLAAMPAVHEKKSGTHIWNKRTLISDSFSFGHGASVKMQKKWKKMPKSKKMQLRKKMKDSDRDGVPDFFDCQPFNFFAQDTKTISMGPHTHVYRGPFNIENGRLVASASGMYRTGPFGQLIRTSSNASRPAQIQKYTPPKLKHPELARQYYVQKNKDLTLKPITRPVTRSLWW